MITQCHGKHLYYATSSLHIVKASSALLSQRSMSVALAVHITTNQFRATTSFQNMAKCYKKPPNEISFTMWASSTAMPYDPRSREWWHCAVTQTSTSDFEKDIDHGTYLYDVHIIIISLSLCPLQDKGLSQLSTIAPVLPQLTLS